ncbi:TerD family protein [Chitinophaga pendula]|uniref:TerD family protein n=1 Tax=Chitinophaga TaxID=79328 RepID=UPI000BB01D39|nr:MULTISPECIES: TerD family protein [Chitinophaga]ASZ11554.1 tellurium resistance protein TerX [Chitinophaga sp. MD30]UCJ05436.1 TerD family protein [Chitinophaga pendula]
MAINLVKGQTIDLRNNNENQHFDITTVTVGLGWDIPGRNNGSLLSKWFGQHQKDTDFNLDAVAFLLDANGKVANLGRTVQMNNGNKVGLYEGDVIFFNNKQHPSGHIRLIDDIPAKGDHQQIIVHLDSLQPQYHKLLFLVSVYQGRQRNQHFGAVENAYIRAVDNNGVEITRFNLSADQNYNGMCSMLFAEVYRQDNSWIFHPMGDPQASDNFIDILKHYVYTQH